VETRIGEKRKSTFLVETGFGGKRGGPLLVKTGIAYFNWLYSPILNYLRHHQRIIKFLFYKLGWHYLISNIFI